MHRPKNGQQDARMLASTKYLAQSLQSRLQPLYYWHKKNESPAAGVISCIIEGLLQYVCSKACLQPC